MIRQLKKMGRVLGASLLAAALAGSSGVDRSLALETPEKSGNFTEMLTPQGHVDWTNGVIRATGIGFPPKDPVSPRHAKIMTKRAALGVALRNLLEALQGVHVNSNTTIKNYMVSNDEIRVKINGIIEGAKVIREQALPDGSYEVTVEMKLTGSLSNVLLPKAGSKPAPKIVGSVGATKAKEAYTGLVVDARGTGARAALAPRILNQDGLEAYSTLYVKGQDLIEQGIVIYVADVTSASSHRRVTDRPLIIKAVGAGGEGRTDLIIRNVDAQTLHVVPEHFGFLEQAQVLVVLDQL